MKLTVPLTTYQGVEPLIDDSEHVHLHSTKWWEKKQNIEKKYSSDNFIFLSLIKDTID